MATNLCSDRPSQSVWAALAIGLTLPVSTVLATAGYCWHLNPGTTVCLVGPLHACRAGSAPNQVAWQCIDETEPGPSIVYTVTSPPPEGQQGRSSTSESSHPCWYKRFRCGNILGEPPEALCVHVSTTFTVHTSIVPNPAGVLCPALP